MAAGGRQVRAGYLRVRSHACEYVTGIQLPPFPGAAIPPPPSAASQPPSPPSGDINLSRDFFSGNVVSLRGGKTDPELEWLIDTAGAWNASQDTRQKRRQKPKWLRNRGEVIAAAYLGDIEFNAALVEDWYAAAADLQSVADAVVCFVHPADAAVIAQLPEDTGSDRLRDFLRGVTARTGMRVLPWQGFELESDHYFDVNHANARGGRERLSRQLVEMLAEELLAITREKG